MFRAFISLFLHQWVHFYSSRLESLSTGRRCSSPLTAPSFCFSLHLSSQTSDMDNTCAGRGHALSSRSLIGSTDSRSRLIGCR